MLIVLRCKYVTKWPELDEASGSERIALGSSCTVCQGSSEAFDLSNGSAVFTVR